LDKKKETRIILPGLNGSCLEASLRSADDAVDERGGVLGDRGLTRGDDGLFLGGERDLAAGDRLVVGDLLGLTLKRLLELVDLGLLDQDDGEHYREPGVDEKPLHGFNLRLAWF